MTTRNTKILGHPAEVTMLSGKAAKALAEHKACSLFPDIDAEAYETLTRSINVGGFDENQPIVVWRKNAAQKRPNDLLVDGRHRRKASLDCELDEIPTAYVDFANEAQVVDFVLIANLGRRHLSPGAKKDLRRKLLAMGKSVKEIATAIGESASSTSHALKPELAAQREEQQTNVQAEIIKGSAPAKIAEATGVSRSTAERATKQANKPKPQLTAITGGKSVPNAGSAPKFDPACDAVFGKKFPVFAKTFCKAATLQSNPVPVADQLALAKECWAAMSETEKGDREKGNNAIAKFMAYQYPTGGNGRRVDAPAAPAPAKKPAAPAPAPAPAAPASNVVPLIPAAPAKPAEEMVPSAKLDEVLAASDLRRAEPKTIEQALGVLLDLRQEVTVDAFLPAVRTLFSLVNKSCIEHPTVPREQRLADLVKVAVGDRPAPAAPAPAAPAGKAKAKGGKKK